LSRGDRLHVRYLEHTFGLSHEEDHASPWYTAEGEEAGLSSDLSMGSSDPIAALIAAPFHALQMLNPAVTRAGFAGGPEQHSGYGAVWPDGGGSTLKPTFPKEFPGPGVATPLTEYSGWEFPDPMTGCPRSWAYGHSPIASAPGLPILVYLPSEPGVVHARVTTGGLRLPVCAFTARTYHSPDRQAQSLARGDLAWFHAVVIIPRWRLLCGHRYQVTLRPAGQPRLRWSFRLTGRRTRGYRAPQGLYC
jgi:hypothetical protein